MPERKAAPPHWIKHNLASRWPHRWIVFDSESRWVTDGDITTHTFRLAVASWWDHNVKSHASPKYERLCDVRGLWQWISDHCTREGRTIVYAHNIGFDIQVCQMFTELPSMGWELGFFTLARDATMVQWRRGAQSLVCTDSLSIFPAKLSVVATLIGDGKDELPENDASDDEWWQRCESDVRILTRAVQAFNDWGRDFDIGNWRPSGSGLAWSMWRHKFLNEQVLAASGAENAAAERAGMVTGRAEAWQTGLAPEGGLHDWDMARCYCSIAAQCDVPVRHRITVPELTVEQYRAWARQGAVLSHVTVTQAEPIVGCKDGSGFRWPVGTFDTWLWSPEIDLLLEEGASVTFGESRRYWARPALREWAEWTLRELTPELTDVPPLVALWVKSQSRSLIGRFGMRYHSWEPHPDGNGLDMVGISMEAGPGRSPRAIMHIGTKAWAECDKVDSDDCVPAITGYVMSEARVRLWRALRAAGDGHVWHVDTDGLLVDATGSERLQGWAESHPEHGWLLKRVHFEGEVRGTRNFSLNGQARIAGVPSSAVRVGPNEWRAEQWQGVRAGLHAGRVDRVQVRETTYRMSAPDSRRCHLDDGSTRAYAPGEYDELHPRGSQWRRKA